MLAAIEIHNKPLFPYRYEVCVLLVINAWELLLKAYLWKFDKRVKIIRPNGTTKDFPECLRCVASNIGVGFQAANESVSLLYRYRNDAAHFFWESLEPIIFSLLKANVTFYGEFVSRYFRIDLAQREGFVLLPIGFIKPLSPIDFLSNTSALATAPSEVRQFVKAIVESSERLHHAGIEDSVLVDFRMNLTNEKRIKNADIVAGINNADPNAPILAIRNVLGTYEPSEDPNAPEVRVSEDSIFKTFYTQEFSDVVAHAREKFENFKQNQTFNRLMAQLKGNARFHKVRYLNPNNPKSGRKDWYSLHVYEELAKRYQITFPLALTTPSDSHRDRETRDPYG